MKTMLSLVLALGLQVSTSSPVVQAQPSCRFVFGFADIATRLGPEIVGQCIENQRTVTGPESASFNSGLNLAILPGAVVQRTTSGLFYWASDTNLTFFTDGTTRCALEAEGIQKESWEALSARVNATPTPPTPASRPRNQWSDREEAQFQCSNKWAHALTLSVGLGMPQAEMDRRKAEADAIQFLCDSAAASHGTRGVACFDKAWEAARGMEHIFPGSGRKAYDDAFAICVAGR